MKCLKTLILILFLLTPLGVFAEESGTLANARTATGTDLVSTTCCDISRIAFHVTISGTSATVVIGCSLRADGGQHVQVSSDTADNTVETTLPCVNIQSDVTACSSCNVTVHYKVIHR